MYQVKTPVRFARLHIISFYSTLESNQSSVQDPAADEAENGSLNSRFRPK